MGTKITSVRNDILVEETDYRSAISENLLSRIGGSINFINSNQLQTFNWRYLGEFVSLENGEDGVLVLPYPVEIIGFSGHIRVSPTKGGSILGIDIHKLNSAGADQGTILENSVQISTSAANNAMFMKNTLTSTETSTLGIGGGGSGAQDLPNILTSGFAAGEGIRIDIMDAVSGHGGRDLSFNVWVRPT